MVSISDHPVPTAGAKLKITNTRIKSKLGTYDRKYLKWDPQGFQLESERLENKVIDASVQQSSLELFFENPRRAMTYIIAGNPDDKEARYFAAWLTQIHLERLGLSAAIRWETVIGNFDNPVLHEEPTLLVLTNLTPRSSNLKYDKTRDLLERHDKIPKLLVIAGEDPLSFAATRLHAPCHGIAYFGSTISKGYHGVI